MSEKKNNTSQNELKKEMKNDTNINTNQNKKSKSIYCEHFVTINKIMPRT